MDPDLLRENLIETLRLASSIEAQREYERNAPIAQVPAEVFCLWGDQYHDDCRLLDQVFDPAERAALAAYDARLGEIAGASPRFSGVEEFYAHPCWRELAEAAARTLAALAVPLQGGSEEDERAFALLRWAVQALAVDAVRQPGLFSDPSCTACELITDFTNWHGATEWRETLPMSEGPRASLQALADSLEGLTETPCFEPEVLRTDVWAVTRAVAVRCLDAFGWAHDSPPEGRAYGSRR